MTKTAWDILLVEQPSLELIRISYKEKMRAILDGTSKMTQSELNSAYNEVKTQEKLDRYLLRYPFRRPPDPKVQEARQGYEQAKTATRKQRGWQSPEEDERENYYDGWAGPVRHGDRQWQYPRNPDGSRKWGDPSRNETVSPDDLTPPDWMVKF